MARRVRQEEADDTFWVEAYVPLSLGLAARRQDIVDRLLAFGPLSVKELADQLGARPSALYHHIRLLLTAGLAVEAGTRVVNRKRVQLFAAPARVVRLRIQPGDPSNRSAVQAFVRVLGRQIERDFRLGLEAGPARTEGPQRTLGLRRVCGSPDAATLARINRKLDEIDALLVDSRGRPEAGVIFSWTLAPLVGGSDPSGDEQERPAE